MVTRFKFRFYFKGYKKYILILGEGPTQGLDDTPLTVEEKYSINFSRLHRKFCLNQHYNE